MKITSHALAIAATVALTSTSFAGTTAKQAIAALKNSEGTSVTTNIIALTGRFGQDQPQEWEILARKGDQSAMYIVDGKSVLSKSNVRTKAAPKLSINLLKFDSNKVFRLADKAAKKASVGFDSLSYDLKPRNDHAAPVWIIDLADSQGSTVGQVHVAADSGSVLRTNWDREQLNRPVVARSAPSTGATRGILADRRNSSTQTGTTAEGIREGLTGVGNSIRNVFRRGQVSKTNQNKSPKTTRTRPTR